MSRRVPPSLDLQPNRALARLLAGALLAIGLAATPVAAERGATELAFEQEVVERVNQARWENGLPPLRRSRELSAAARHHSDTMGQNGFFSHCDLETGRLPGDQLAAAGYEARNWGANVAAGQVEPAAVMKVWLESAGHRTNILSPEVREIGVGYHFDLDDDRRVRISSGASCDVRRHGGPFFHYWTQTFGRRDGVFPVVVDREAATTDSRSVRLYVYGEGWAEQMRLANEDEEPGAWRPFTAEVDWRLSEGAGTKTVRVELRRGDRVVGAVDSIELQSADR